MRQNGAPSGKDLERPGDAGCRIMAEMIDDWGNCTDGMSDELLTQSQAFKN